MISHDVIHPYKAMQPTTTGLFINSEETKEGGVPFGKRARGRGGVEDLSALVDI